LNERNLSFPLRIKRKSVKCNYPLLTFQDVFGATQSSAAGLGFTLQTVHAAKGQSLEAVLLILKKKAGRTKYYVNLLGHPITDNEELRIVYVAMTRAKRTLEIAVPTEDVTVWKTNLRLAAPGREANTD
jgi:superfamily I DNA/RNA helicase